MKHTSRFFRRAAAIILALAMILTAVPQSVFAMDSSELDSAIPLTLDEPVSFQSEDGKLLLSFTPEETRPYIFYMAAADNCEPYAEVYDADLTLLASENLYSDTITCEFSAGATYYFEVTNLLDTAEFSASVCLTMPSDDSTTITFHANGGYFTQYEWDYEADKQIEIHVDSVSETYFKEDILYSWNTPTVENEDPAKAFAGFATTENAEVADVVFEETRAGDLTDLWAVWTEGIPVTYHINHDEIRIRGDEDIPVTEITEYHPAGSSFHIGGLPYDYIKPEGSLWQMDGLSTDPEATQGDYTDITLTEPLDLYCVWYEGVELYFNANGGSFGDQQTTANSVFRLGTTAYDLTHHWSELTPPDAGMALAGWSWTADGSDMAANDLAITRDLNGKTLYAVWSNGIPVTFHINSDQAWFNTDGNPADTITRFYAPGAILHSYDSPFSFDIEEDSFLCYDGISQDPNASDNSYWEIAVTEPIDLYCIWFLGVEINYNANGGYFWGDPMYTTYPITYRIGEFVDLMDRWNNGDLSHPDPDKALLGFSWFPDGRNSFTEFTPDEDMLDQTLYAVWGDGITVTFHVNSDVARFIDSNGNRVETIQKTFAPGTVLWSYQNLFDCDTGEDPFLYYEGFYPEETVSETYDRQYTITEPTDFYLSWFRGVIIRFDANGGFFFGDSTRTYIDTRQTIGRTVNLINYWGPDLTNPDSSKTLVGWSWNEDGSDPITSLTAAEEHNGRTLYAVWGDGIIVTYHSLNENVWFLDANGNKTDTIQVSYSSGTVLDHYNIRIGYHFDRSITRWFFDNYYRDAEGTNLITEDITVTEPIDLYCSWYEGVGINMNANGGLFWGRQESVEYIYRIGDTTNFNRSTYPITPPSEDLVLSGWSWKADGSDPITTLPITKDLDGKTLYAIWDTGIQVTLHANLEGAYFTDDSGNHVSDLTLKLKKGTLLSDILYMSTAVAPDGSKFSDSYSRSLTPGGNPLPSDTVLTDGMDLYVIWVTFIPVTLDAGDGTYGGQQTYQFKIRSNSYFSPDWYTAKPGQEGMAFLGWSLTNSKDDIIHGSLSASDYKDGLTLHAIYVPGHPLTIKTNNPDYGKLGVFENGASYDYDNIPAETTFLMAEGKALKYLSVDIMPSDGYVFLGWSKTIDGEILDEDYIPDQDSVLYGIFAEGYSVFLSANGGTFDETLQSTVGFKVVNVLKGSAIGEIPVWHPTKTFAGWNTKPDGSGETIDLATYIPTGFLELYAIWTDAGSDIPVTGVSFAETSVTILVEGTKSCPATVAPANATNKKVTYKSSNESVVTVDANGKLTGKLVGKATITATTADGGKKATLNVQVLFKDVADSAKYWFKPVYWAAEKGITNGYQSASYKGTAKFGTFGSEENCTREQMITFLYREAGSPAVSNADITKYNTFSDVKSSAKPYYLKAVVWAAKNGITKGYSSGPNKGKFGVGLPVTREDTVTFIYRMAKIYQKGFEDVKSEDLTNKDYKFSDVASGKYYQKPIVWAAKNGITKGYSSGPNKGKFGVGFDVLRKDIVTFLYRYDNL